MARTLITKKQIENLQIANADIASSAAIATSKLAEGADFIQRDGSVPYTANQSMGNFRLTNLGAPVSSDDAVRLVDLQNNQAGLSGKEAARVATTANITLSGVQAIDGITLVAGDRVLVKNQTAASANGIYVVAVGAWARSTDADTAAELKSGTYIFVSEGTTNADSGWLLSTDGTITLGTTALNWVQFTGAGQVNAGQGLTKNGNTIDVGTASASRIVVNSDNIDLALTGVGAGTYTKLTVDVYGRVSAATQATYADVGAQPANANLSNLAAISGNGIYVSTGANTNVIRTLLGTAGRVGVVNGDGVGGNPTIDLLNSGVTVGTYDTVTVDTYGRVTNGSNTGMALSKYIVREVPSGLVNGVNTTFTLASIPVVGKEMVYLNGQLLEPGAGNDYTISGQTITMLAPLPTTGDIIRVTYMAQ